MLAASAGELWPQLRAFGPRMEPGWTRGSPLEPQLGLTDGPVPGTYSARSYTCNFAARTLTPDCFFFAARLPRSQDRGFESYCRGVCENEILFFPARRRAPARGRRPAAGVPRCAGAAVVGGGASGGGRWSVAAGDDGRHRRWWRRRWKCSEENSIRSSCGLASRQLQQQQARWRVCLCTSQPAPTSQLVCTVLACQRASMGATHPQPVWLSDSVALRGCLPGGQVHRPPSARATSPGTQPPSLPCTFHRRAR